MEQVAQGHSTSVAEPGCLTLEPALRDTRLILESSHPDLSGAGSFHRNVFPVLGAKTRSTLAVKPSKGSWCSSVQGTGYSSPSPAY